MAIRFAFHTQSRRDTQEILPKQQNRQVNAAVAWDNRIPGSSAEVTGNSGTSRESSATALKIALESRHEIRAFGWRETLKGKQDLRIREPQRRDRTVTLRSQFDRYFPHAFVDVHSVFRHRVVTGAESWRKRSVELPVGEAEFSSEAVNLDVVVRPIGLLAHPQRVSRRPRAARWPTCRRHLGSPNRAGSGA